jgi:hypothetical protein
VRDQVREALERDSVAVVHEPGHRVRQRDELGDRATPFSTRTSPSANHYGCATGESSVRPAEWDGSSIDIRRPNQ